MADATGGDRRRWLVGAGAAVVAVGVVAFLLGASGGRTPVPIDPVPPAVATTAPVPATDVPAPVLVSEADLMAPPEEVDDVVPALEAYLGVAFTGERTVVDRVQVEPIADGGYSATISVSEVDAGGRRPLAPIGLVVRAADSPTGVVVEYLAPASVAPVVLPGSGGQVAEVPDPVRDALLAALEPWPGSVVEAVGTDAGRWWAQVGLPLPSGARLPLVVWPDLVVGLGSGG